MLVKLKHPNFSEKNLIISDLRKIDERAYPMHWHDYFEMEYVLSGGGRGVIDGKPHPIEPGMVILTSPFNIHSVIAKNLHVINISFYINICDPKILSALNLTNSAITIKLDECDREFVKVTATELMKNVEDEEYSEILLNSILTKLQKSTPKKNHNTAFSIPQKARLYIINNFKKNLSLNEVADYVGLTPAYLSSLFKKETGSNFKEYVNELRLKYAKKLILISDMTIRQICIESGFKNYDNFIRRFKSRFGTTPKNYRTENLTD